MQAAAGVRLLVDHSVEERETEADWQHNLGLPQPPARLSF